VAERASYRAGDSDRRQVVDQLATHFGAGRLTAYEFEQRSADGWAARTYGQLDALLADLPRDPVAAPLARHRLSPAQLAGVATAVLLVMLIASVAAGWTRGLTGCI